eukprot:COSAG02_NODE_496_length_21109_cov_5.047025_4_plen_192_part_00
MRAGNWAAVPSGKSDSNAAASPPATQESESAADTADHADGAGSSGRKFSKGLPKAIGAGGMRDRAKQAKAAAREAAERAKKEAEKAAAGAAAGATAVAARASGEMMTIHLRIVSCTLPNCVLSTSQRAGRAGPVKSEACSRRITRRRSTLRSEGQLAMRLSFWLKMIPSGGRVASSKILAKDSCQQPLLRL